MGSILTASVWSNVPVIALYGIIGVEVLQILRLRVTELGSRFDEGVFSAAAGVSTFGYVDRAIVAMSIFVALAMIGLKLRGNEIRNNVLYKAS